jgi:D-sedoheptulose 7-phosphate isomerase
MTIETFTTDYLDALKANIEAIPVDDVKAIIETINDAWASDKQIFVIGNGGSAATAAHIVCDLAKGTLGHKGDAEKRRFKCFAPADNVSLVTAWANDTSYENIFAEQLANFVQEGDVLIALSASGQSPNIIKAVELANERGAHTIGLCGFGGGRLQEISDQCIIVDSDHYGHVEDVHLIIGHIICYYFQQV